MRGGEAAITEVPLSNTGNSVAAVEEPLRVDDRERCNVFWEKNTRCECEEEKYILNEGCLKALFYYIFFKMIPDGSLFIFMVQLYLYCLLSMSLLRKREKYTYKTYC